MRTTAFPLLLAFATLGGATPASADAIDGHWCFTGGLRLSINGPEIVTPGGSLLKGIYDRHGFSYVVPAPEPGAGATVVMTLLNEQTVQLRTGTDAQAPMQIWQRCSATISRAPAKSDAG
jgi:hypothetical protein